MSRINNPDFLKLHLPLNNHTEDLSGNGNDGTPTSLGFAEGPYGLSVGDFDGVTSKIEMGNILDQGANDSFTISGWFRTTSTSTQIPLAKRGSRTTIADAGYSFDLGSSARQLLFRISDGVTESLVTTQNILIFGEIIFFTVTLDRVLQTMNLFINAVAIDTSPSVDISTIGSLSNSLDLRISGADDEVDEWGGQIWNTRVYNIAITQEEVLEIFNLERRSPKLVELQQPFNLLPDITDPSLELAILNEKVHNTFRDYSNNANDPVSANNNIAFEERSGASFLQISK